MAEHVIVLALVAVSAIGAWSALGASIEHRVECVAGALGGRAADCAARPARPGASTARARAALVREPARDGSYATRLREALDALADRPTFDALSGRDGRITRDDLAAVLAQPGAYDDRAWIHATYAEGDRVTALAHGQRPVTCVCSC